MQYVVTWSRSQCVPLKSNRSFLRHSFVKADNVGMACNVTTYGLYGFTIEVNVHIIFDVEIFP